jgi:RNA polymerase sigma factor (sigma-70 family)
METGDDEAAFHDFVVSRVAALSRTAYLLTGDFHLAEDLVQTALFKTAKAWHRIQGDPEAYVRRILYTQNVSWWRSRRNIGERSLESYDDHAAAAGDHELRMSLDGALGQLTPKQRTVLVLRYYEDRPSARASARPVGRGDGGPRRSGRGRPGERAARGR